MSIAENLQRVRERLARACDDAGRDPASVRLLAASKKMPVQVLREAHEAGQFLFGENRAQELRDKADVLGRGYEWHFIGSLQKNKVRVVVDRAVLIHSVDSLELAREISARATRRVGCLVQVNVSREDSKAGCRIEDALDLASQLKALPNLDLRGLMTIPAPSEDPLPTRRAFEQLTELAAEGRARGLSLDVLSMGMSHDLELAVAAGSTLVRIGTAIFGERP